jgi:hypothetical protein
MQRRYALAVKRLAQVLGAALVVLGIFGAAYEGSHGLGALGTLVVSTELVP